MYPFASVKKPEAFISTIHARKLFLFSLWWECTLWHSLKSHSSLCIHSTLSCQSSPPAPRIKMIILRNESLKLLTQKKYCQPKPSLFHQVCLCFEWPKRESHMNLGPTQSESQMRQMTPHFKGKWLQRETKTNSLRRVISFRTVPIHSSLWIFTFFF